MKQHILWDCHMHSCFSSDSDTPMETMIRQGIRQGLSGICFTEHFDPDYPKTPDNLTFSLDFPSYMDTFFSLKEKYQREITLHFGVELGLQPHLNETFASLLSRYPFDFVIGSSHVVNGFDPYYPEFFQTREESVGYREYFESILKNISAFNNFDTYGHLDYIVRYGPNKNRDYSYQKYADLFDEILTQLITRQIGLEINTGGYHYGLGEPNPCVKIIQRYRELGGEIITIGADAHTPEKIGFAFEKAAKVLSECGFRYYTVFEKRKADFLPLE